MSIKQDKTVIHTIKAPCHQSTRDQGFQFGADEIKEAYDHEINIKRFDGSSVGPEGVTLCPGYRDLYQYIFDYKMENPKDKILTVGGDGSIAASTVGAMNDYYMRQKGETFSSDLVIVWIDSQADLETYHTSTTGDLPEMALSSLMGHLDPPISPQKLNLDPDNLILFGLSEDYKEIAGELGITNITNKKVQVLGSDCLDIIKELVGDKPVHVHLDMKVFNDQIAPSTHPRNINGVKENHVQELLSTLKDSIVSMDIVEYNPRIGSNADTKMTRELARRCLIYGLGFTENKINIFTEDTEFLVYRTLEQHVDEIENDIGWYIMRGMTTDQKEEFLAKLPDDRILTVDIEGEDYLVTKTTMNDQNEKSYFLAEKIEDVVLFPDEKSAMAFELIN